jgi:lipoate-protein ligase A
MDSGPTQSIAQTNAYILKKHQAALGRLLRTQVGIQGQSDLALKNLKFSGNAQRRKRKFLMFHGTFLLNFDIPLIEKYLLMPSKQPDYRQDRTHEEFLTNLHLSAAETKAGLLQAWEAREPADNLPLAKLAPLVQKYSADDWNLKF